MYERARRQRGRICGLRAVAGPRSMLHVMAERGVDVVHVALPRERLADLPQMCTLLRDGALVQCSIC